MHFFVFIVSMITQMFVIYRKEQVKVQSCWLFLSNCVLTILPLPSFYFPSFLFSVWKHMDTCTQNQKLFSMPAAKQTEVFTKRKKKSASFHTSKHFKLSLTKAYRIPCRHVKCIAWHLVLHVLLQRGTKWTLMFLHTLIGSASPTPSCLLLMLE